MSHDYDEALAELGFTPQVSWTGTDYVHESGALIEEPYEGMGWYGYRDPHDAAEKALWSDDPVSIARDLLGVITDGQ